MLRISLEKISSPLGDIIVGTDEAGFLRIVDFADCQTRMRTLLDRHYGKGNTLLERRRGSSSAARALSRYFRGELGAIKTLKVAHGGTAFQRKVWRALRAIPAGRTVSYGALAKILGMPKAARAVGLANGANPVAIVVPCHRVIGVNGGLTGYGGGMKRKAWLLAHEARG
jgi:methylated-DNA-[protein]-cysteine S-methyltransferase